MSVNLIDRPEEYIGLSSDTKPTSNITVGSTFFETDTSNVYIFNGTAWSII